MIIFNRKRAWNSYVKQAKIPFPTIISNEKKALNNSHITVVAYHTDDDLYTHEAKRLCASAERLNFQVELTIVNDLGDWLKNTSYKSVFLKKAREEIRGPILYVDVDAVFHRSPLESLINIDCDIAICRDLQDGHLMSGTILLNDTKKTLELMTEWEKSCKFRVDVWDQKVLDDILTRDKLSTNSYYKVSELPVEYCWIFDRESNLKRHNDVVYIEHLQASRSVLDEQRFKQKRRWFHLRSKSVQRRIDRVIEIEKILFGN